MTYIFNALLIGITLIFILYSIKSRFYIGLVTIGVFLSTILTSVGINTNRVALMYTIFAVCILFVLLTKEKLSISKNSIILIGLFSMFLIIYVISFTYSFADTSDYAMWKLRSYFSLCFIPPILVLVIGKLKEKELTVIENFIICISIVFSAYLLFLFIGGEGLSTDAEWFQRQSVGGVNPIWIARFMSLGFIILQSNRFKNHQIESLVLSTLIILSSLLTGSKIILFITVPLGLIMRLKEAGENKKILKNIIFISIVGIAIGIFITSFNSDAITRRFSLESGTVGKRLTMFEMTYNAYISEGNIFFGNGAGTIANSLGYGFIRWYPHNLVLELLYEVGLLGTIIYFLPVFFLIYIGTKTKFMWILLAGIMYSLFSLTSGDLVSNNLIYFLIALYILSCEKYINNKDNVKDYYN